jgi:transglutaminase-like putative cysteine protease
VRLLLQHRTHYGYDRPAALGPHTIRLRPATHAKAKIETYALRVEQPSSLRWQEDPAGNHVARVTFPGGQRVNAFDVTVEMAIDVRPVNPFDFFVDPRCEKMPFEYPGELARDLAPYLDKTDPAYATGPLFASFLADVPPIAKTIDRLVALNQAVNRRLRYVIREESGVWTPERTLTEKRGSCRDSAVILVAALRA